MQGDEIDVDTEPYSDNFARPARLLPLEAKALVAAIDLLGDHLPEGSLGSARDKIVAALGDDPAHEGLQIAHPRHDDCELARTINTAIAERRLLELDYYKENEDEFTERKVEPYALINGREGWYLFCYDRGREDTRHFRLDRIRRAKLLERDVRAARRGRPDRRPRGLAPHGRRSRLAGGARLGLPRARALGARAARRVTEELRRRRADRRASVRGRRLARARGAEGGRRRRRARARGRPRSGAFRSAPVGRAHARRPPAKRWRQRCSQAGAGYAPTHRQGPRRRIDGRSEPVRGLAPGLSESGDGRIEPGPGGRGGRGSGGRDSVGLWYQLFRRPLPKTKRPACGQRPRVAGRRSARPLRRAPHRRPLEADLASPIGFCLGQDRLWQLEFYRRAATGRLSEFAGPDGAQADRLMRTLGARAAREREVATIPRSGRAYLEAYAAGINAAIERRPALPIEFQLAAHRARAVDAGRQPRDRQGRRARLRTNMETELFRAELVKLIGAEKVGAARAAVPAAATQWSSKPGRAVAGGGIELAAADRRGPRRRSGSPLEPAGSNNWVVSGERSVTGKPLLANDPHISATIPDVWYAVELSSPDIEMRGGSLPGTPGCVIGQTSHVAWGFTNVMADVQDLFVERVRTAHEAAAGLRVRGRVAAGRGAARDDRACAASRRRAARGSGDPPRPDRQRALGAAGEPLALAWTALREPWPSAAGSSWPRAPRRRGAGRRARATSRSRA